MEKEINEDDSVCPIALVNIVVIICWLILAITFNHWWIMLFSLLSLFSSKKEVK